MKYVFMLLVSIFVVTFSISAFAEGAQTNQTTEYNFDDDVVEGDLVRPDGEMALVRRRGRQSSLIQVRQHFIPEMLKSVEDL